MIKVSSNASISKLFMHGRSHLGCSLVLILLKGTQRRTISINAISSTFSKSNNNDKTNDLIYST